MGIAKRQVESLYPLNLEQKQLFPLIHQEVIRLLNNYVKHPMILEHIDEYITPPVLGNRAGACGAIALAQALVGQ